MTHTTPSTPRDDPWHELRINIRAHMDRVEELRASASAVVDRVRADVEAAKTAFEAAGCTITAIDDEKDRNSELAEVRKGWRAQAPDSALAIDVWRPQFKYGHEDRGPRRPGTAGTTDPQSTPAHEQQVLWSACLRNGAENLIAWSVYVHLDRERWKAQLVVRNRARWDSKALDTEATQIGSMGEELSQLAAELAKHVNFGTQGTVEH